MQALKLERREDTFFMFSHIPATNKKTPNGSLLEQATGTRKWKQFTKRKPTNEELEIFMQSDYIATVTGEVSNITVIDLDGNAETYLNKLGYKLPHTPTMKTQNGGKHLYFQYSDQIETTTDINQQHKNDSAIDVRNNNAYVLSYGKGYEWLITPYEAKLQPLPRIFIDMYDNAREQERTIESTQKERIRVSESINSAYDEANNIDMVEFLRYHNYEVAEEGKAFSCLFHDHEDSNPSSVIYRSTKTGSQRYLCHSHHGGKLNLSLIDLWKELNNLTINESVKEILSFKGIEYRESEFIQREKDKYHYNTMKVNDLTEIKEHYPALYKYLKRYELELRSIMDYAEANLYGSEYSYKDKSIFYLSTRQVAKDRMLKRNSTTLNTRRSHTALKLLSLFNFMQRIPAEEVPTTARNRAKRFMKDDREISFYTFNELSDMTLSNANNIAITLDNSNFKADTMTKDLIIATYGMETANRVFPDNREQSHSYKTYLLKFSKVINQLILENGYTSKNDVLENIDLPHVKTRTKSYHFDKVINEICTSYDIEYNFMTKELKKQFNIPMSVRRKLLYQR